MLWAARALSLSSEPLRESVSAAGGTILPNPTLAVISLNPHWQKKNTGIFPFKPSVPSQAGVAWGDVVRGLLRRPRGHGEVCVLPFARENNRDFRATKVSLGRLADSFFPTSSPSALPALYRTPLAAHAVSFAKERFCFVRRARNLPSSRRSEEGRAGWGGNREQPHVNASRGRTQPDEAATLPREPVVERRTRFGRGSVPEGRQSEAPAPVGPTAVPRRPGVTDGPWDAHDAEAVRDAQGDAEARALSRRERGELLRRRVVLAASETELADMAVAAGQPRFRGKQLRQAVLGGAATIQGDLTRPWDALVPS